MQGLYYSNGNDIWYGGCVQPIFEFYQLSSEAILAPIMITVSIFELIFLTKALRYRSASDFVKY